MYKRTFFIIAIGMLLFLSMTLHLRAAIEDERFLAGYATAVIEREFHVKVNNISMADGVMTVHTVSVISCGDREAITLVLKNMPAIQKVVFKSEGVAPDVATTARRTSTENVGEKKEATDRKNFLFEPILADPRWPHFSASYQRYFGEKEVKNVGSTTFGATFSLYRGDGPFEGSWDLGLQAGVFAIFDLDAASKDLLNADYWVALPVVAYRLDRLSFLGRIFHQSSHLGDEYLLRSRVDRVNLSYEAFDLTGSYGVDDIVRAYGGFGYMFNREPSDLKPLWFQYGVEFRDRETYLKGFLRPVAAIGMQHHQENRYRGDITLKAGVRMEHHDWVVQRYLLLEYFNGQSPNGQFYDRTVNYLGLGAHFYF